MKVTKLGVARIAAWLLLANGMLGLAPSAWSWLAAGRGTDIPYLPFLGIICGYLSLRGLRAGAWGGIAFYAVQVLSIYPYSGAWSFSMKAGLSLAYVGHVSDAVLVVNVAALLLLALSVLLLLRPPPERQRSTAR